MESNQIGGLTIEVSPRLIFKNKVWRRSCISYRRKVDWF